MWKRLPPRARVVGALALLCACLLLDPEAKAANRPTIVVLGDSISAGYSLQPGTGWVALLRDRLARQHYDYNVANGSISGDTTSGARARLPALLDRLRPAILILELGGNDGLRGIPIATARDNLQAMIELSRQNRVQVVLVGMYLPPNLGTDYTRQFKQMYIDLARRFALPFVPFLLAGIENDPSLFQPDRIHPTQDAQPVLLDNVWPKLLLLLRAQH